MGFGDNLMATGMARGARARGKRIAFGDGKRIIWDHNSEAIFRGNPNVARTGSEEAKDIEWVPFYRGNRLYNKQGKGRWIWNYEFQATPGEMFFDESELLAAERSGRDFILIEPNVPHFKTCAPNKQWGLINWTRLARRLLSRGHQVKQFYYSGSNQIAGVGQIKTHSFRHALSVLARAKLYVGPEGGLHHGAAAVGIPAVVLFGGFIPPSVTGYDTHTNLTGGAEACGSLHSCDHCRAAMEAIAVRDVETECLRYLSETAMDRSA